LTITLVRLNRAAATQLNPFQASIQTNFQLKLNVFKQLGDYDNWINPFWNSKTNSKTKKSHFSCV